MAQRGRLLKKNLGWVPHVGPLTPEWFLRMPQAFWHPASVTRSSGQGGSTVGSRSAEKASGQVGPGRKGLEGLETLGQDSGSPLTILLSLSIPPDSILGVVS